jgi:transposase InsO family protein
VKTHVGWVFVAFIIDVFSRMIVGWQASMSLRSSLAIDALEMAVWNRHRAGCDLDGLVHHSDRGAQYRSIRYSERLAANGIVASVRSRGDSYDKQFHS